MEERRLVEKRGIRIENEGKNRVTKREQGERQKRKEMGRARGKVGRSPPGTQIIWRRKNNGRAIK